jgi:hypothetical protein
MRWLGDGQSKAVLALLQRHVRWIDNFLNGCAGSLTLNTALNWLGRLLPISQRDSGGCV